MEDTAEGFEKGSFTANKNYIQNIYCRNAASYTTFLRPITNRRRANTFQLSHL